MRLLALDAMLSRYESTRRLLSQVKRGDIKPSEIEQSRRQRLLAHSNADLKSLAADALAVAGSPARADVVKQFSDALKLSGDAARGHVLFVKHCAVCHQFNGEGHVVGPDLASGAARTGQTLVEAIFDPGREIDQRYQAYVAVSGGLARSGILKAETETSITLVSQDGKSHTLRRNDLDELSASPVSFMPEGFEKELSPQGVADLVQYLTTSAGGH
jgi:putative heme-binding domain-containing protein